MLRILSFYWRSIVSTLIAFLLVATAASAYYYQQTMQQEAYLRKASCRYEELIAEIDSKAQALSVETANQFVTDFAKTPYPALLQLKLAAQAIANNQLKEAFDLLKSASEQTKDKDIRCIALQRGARVLASMNQPQKALLLLDDIKEEAYISTSEELKGDFYMLLKEEEKALKAYQKAVKSSPELAATKPLLQRKINELKHLEQPTV